MRRPMLRASWTSLAAAMLVIGGGAEAAPAKQAAAPAPSNADEWALIGLTPQLVASAAGGSGVSVAVLDGRADCRHPDLAGHCANYLIPGGVYRKYDSHGTHTSGIVAGKKYGVAGAAKILNYGVFDDRTYVATGTKLIDAWRAAGATGATIASMSFGCSRLALCFTAAEVQAMADPNLKMLFVKAAGNDGATLLSEAIGVSAATAAAAMARLVLVGSVNLTGTISSFSNRPGETCLMYSGAGGCSPDTLWKYHFIVAPGENIYSTLPNGAYGYMSGTSMATPVVAGVAALLEARWPALKTSPETVAQILFTSATDKGAPGVDATYGWGLLNATKAFQAYGNVTLVSTSGAVATMGTPQIAGAGAFGTLSVPLGKVTVYDAFGRDFALAETGALRVSRNYDADRRMPARRLLGIGGQADWTGAFFAKRYAPRGFAAFASLADPTPMAVTPDRSLRLGVDMPFKGGVAQLRVTGETGTRLDFAYDPTLRPLSFFPSTGLLNSSLFAHALVGAGAHSRLSLYGVTTSAGSITGTNPNIPFYLQQSDGNSAASLALVGSSAQRRQQGIGAGYWLQPDGKSVIGFNASMLIQKGGYYDLTSNLPAFRKPTRMLNLGAAVSRTFGSWEATATGELTHLRASNAVDWMRLSSANVASAELRLRKNGAAFAGGGLEDSMSIALVMPPRAVSGSLQLDYMTRTADGLGRQATTYRYSLADAAEPLKVEAAYQLSEGSSWSFDISGGYYLQRSDYSGAGEALTSFHLAF